MISTRQITQALLVVTLGFTTGCMSLSDRSFTPVMQEIATQLPELEMRKEFAMSIGSAMFNAIDVIAIGSEFDFSAVDKMQIAVYEVAYGADLSELDVEKSLMARDPTLSWQTVVKVREEDESTWVMVAVNETRNTIEAVSIMVLEQGELVLINVTGELQDMIEFALNPARKAGGERGERGARGERGVVKFS